MPDEWKGFKALGRMSFNVNTETGQFDLKTDSWAIVPDQEGPLLDNHFVEGIGLVITAQEALNGRINYNGRVYSVERIDPTSESSITITRHADDKEPEAIEYKFMDAARVFVEDVETRTVDRRHGFIVQAVQAGGLYTIQNWRAVLEGTAPRWEVPITAGTRFDREVVDEEP